MPRFRISDTYNANTHGTNQYTDGADDAPDGDDGADRYDDLHAYFDSDPAPRRRRDRSKSGPGLALEGKSGRRLVDVDGIDIDSCDLDTDRGESQAEGADAPFSSYDVAGHGPDPTPHWLITELSARDHRLGVIKTGKEADVSLLERRLTDGEGCLLAVKTFRTADHRMFHRDAGYLEGRRVKRSRETRAMANRTGFGREMLTGQWATAEFRALARLWTAGARVPYPVQIIGSELMMEFIGTPEGQAAPRLAAADGTTADFVELWHDLVSTLEVLAEAGYTHGDLSPYNVLVDEQGCVLIDLPQVVDLVANPQGESFLRRDCWLIADFFARRGVLAADAELLALHLGALARP